MLISCVCVVTGSVGGPYYDDEQFVQPIKSYICDYLNHYVS